MILTVSELTHHYGDNLVLDGVDFAVQENDRIGIVGDNGCGKTTLLELICGGLTIEAGGVYLKKGTTLGYLRQSAGLDEHSTLIEVMRSAGNRDALLARMAELETRLADDLSVLDEYGEVCARFEAAGGYDAEYLIVKVLNGFSFPESMYDIPVGKLSGGEKTRLAVAKLLVSSPELIVLDEPTNHLDADTSRWLAGFLSEYMGAVLVVSHDTAFLDRVCNRILEISNHHATLYHGNYSAYKLQKSMSTESERREYERTLKKARELEDYAKRNIVRASTSNMAKSRLKMLSRLDLSAPENTKHERIAFRFPETQLPYKELLTVKGLTVGVAGKPLFECEDFVLLRGENLAVVGANGCGKTTFLKILLRKTQPLVGRASFGGGVKTAYFEQNIFTDIKKSSLDYIWDFYPSYSALDVRNLLATVGLRGEEVFIPINELSGGERARLMLLRLSLLRPNVLVLDEPTNHLDVYSREILTDTLNHFFGTLILVSHDRALVSALNCRVLAIRDGRGICYKNWAAYEAAGTSPISKITQRPIEAKGTSQKDARRAAAQARARRAELEALISSLEDEVAALENEISLPEVACDAERLNELCDKLSEKRGRLDSISEEWLTISEQ